MDSSLTPYDESIQDLEAALTLLGGVGVNLLEDDISMINTDKIDSKLTELEDIIKALRTDYTDTVFAEIIKSSR